MQAGGIKCCLYFNFPELLWILYVSLEHPYCGYFFMLFEFNVRSGMLLLFFIAGLAYAVLLGIRGRNNDTAADRLLGIFLLLCCLFIFPWMAGYAGWYDGSKGPYRNILFYTPFQHQLFFGPVIYFYVQSLLNSRFQWRKKDWWHFVPGMLYLLWCAIVFVTDRLVLNRYFLMNGETDPDFDTWYQVAGFVFMLFYLARSISYYYRYRKFTQQELSFADSVSFLWVRNFLFAFTAYLLITAVKELLGLLSGAGIIRELNYGDAWWYYIVFSFIFYYIAISGYNNSSETKVGFQYFKFLQYSQQKSLGPGANNPQRLITNAFEDIDYEEVDENAQSAAGNETGSTFFTPEQLQEWKERVEQLIQQEGLYKNPELTLTGLAKKLHTNASFLSKVINNGFGVNFNDFINRYRVNEVKALLADDANANITIMSLAYDAGFNSKATFNRAFKKFTGKNPKDFSANFKKPGSNDEV
jgi:AraC-like DNA-binding protein